MLELATVDEDTEAMVGSVMVPPHPPSPKMSCPNSWNLGMCYTTWKMGLKYACGIKVANQRIFSEIVQVALIYLQGPSDGGEGGRRAGQSDEE